MVMVMVPYNGDGCPFTVANRGPKRRRQVRAARSDRNRGGVHSDESRCRLRERATGALPSECQIVWYAAADRSRNATICDKRELALLEL
jgi:hypothetical protein